MENKVDFSEFKSLVVVEPEPASAPLFHPTSRASKSIGSSESDWHIESGIDLHALETAPRVTRLSPVFELASVSHGSAHQLTFSQQDSALADGRLKSSIDAALALLVSRLGEDESLIAPHSFHPEDSGAMGVSSRLHIERTSHSMPAGPQPKEAALLADIMTDWRGVFRTGLALLSEEYSFRQLEAQTLVPHARREFLQFDSCCVAGQSSMGFTGGSDSAAPVCLPLWASVSGSSIWPAALERTIKAARAQEVAVAVGVKISRFSLTGQQRSTLEKLDVSSDFQGRIHGTVLSKVRQTFVDHAGEFLRIDPFIEVNPSPLQAGAFASWSSRRASALVDVFAKEVLPLHTGGHLACGDGLPRLSPRTRSSDCLDLTTAMPFSGSLPPLLAKPQVLRELDFPRHHGNHSLRLPTEGLLLGTAQVGGFEREVRLRQEDRSRHVYMVGGTGTGKTSVMYNMILQDMDQGRGLALCDPAGDLFEQVLERIPQDRVDDVVIIDPSDASMAVGLNPLDFGDAPTPLAVNRVIGDLLDIFESLYDMKVAGGPGFEQHFRNAMLLAVTAPYDSPSQQGRRPSFNTVLALLRDKDWREYLLGKVKQSFLGEDMGAEVFDFFGSAEATSGDQAFRNWVPYVSNKLSRFTSNPLLRQLLCSKHRTIDFRKIMDQKQILLVNLSKGAVGSLDASMIGMLVSKGLFGAAMSRFDVPKNQRVPFTYYCDEVQNFVTPDIGTVLAEGRKWGLQMVLAHQSIGQLRTGTSRAVLDAILGNIPTQLVFRTGMEEAALLEQAMQPQIDRLTLSQLPDRQVAARLLIDNKVSVPFIFTTQTVVEDRSQTEQEQTAALARQASREKYGIATSEASIPAAAPPPAKPVRTLMNGFVKLRGALTHDEGAKLVRDDSTALAAWMQTIRTDPFKPVTPQPGRLYRTSNRSLVFVTSVDGNGDAKAVVLEGGHLVAALPGERPGESYNLTASGEYHGSHSSGRLVGMSLQVEIEIPQVTELWCMPQGECSFNWLLEPEFAKHHEMKTAGRGFYQTLDGSIVYVTAKQDADGEYKSIVLSGGHGIEQFLGTGVADFFYVDSAGTYCLSSKVAKESSPIKLAAASGMSLARRLDAPALDTAALGPTLGRL